MPRAPGQSGLDARGLLYAFTDCAAESMLRMTGGPSTRLAKAIRATLKDIRFLKNQGMKG